MKCSIDLCEDEATHRGLTKPKELCKKCSKTIIFMVKAYGSRAAEVLRGLKEYKERHAKIEDDAPA